MNPYYFTNDGSGQVSGSQGSQSPPWVDLDIDSDNNGYINNPGNNSERAQAEDDMEESTAKPITLFRNEDGVPDCYKCEPLRVKFYSGTSNQFSFICTENIAVYERNGDVYTKIPSGLKLPIYGPTGFTGISALADGDDDYRAYGDGKYYVKAVPPISSSSCFPAGYDKVDLVLWEITGRELARDIVSVLVADTPPGWIVPRGWRIDSNSFTTPMPIDGAIGPKEEGSGVFKMHSGDAYSVKECTDGFTLEFNYSFERNSIPGTTKGYPAGYVQPDINNRNEILDDDDRRQMDFFGNSGVKIFGVYEIQIFDTRAMVNGLKITSADVDVDGVVKEKDVEINGKTRRYRKEPVNKLISGIAYGIGNCHYKDLMDAYNRQSEFGANYMKIEFKKDGAAYRIRVYGRDSSAVNVLLFEDEGITKGTGGSPVSFDKAPIQGIRLQSHWGSGVTFSNVILTGPPAAWW